ncbi:MAG: ATP-dependent DNA helicase RecG, partial [Phycisphaerales bacterium]
LESPVQFVKGVGPLRAEQLAGLGIRTVRDLIQHYPFRYGAQEAARPIADLVEGHNVTVVGTLADVRYLPHRRRAPIRALVEDETGECEILWFQSAYLADKLNLGDRLRLHGKARLGGDMFQLVNPQTEWLREQDEKSSTEERLEPVYPASMEITSRQLKRWIRAILPGVLGELPELHAPLFLRERRLPTISTAVQRIHVPRRNGDAQIARRRLAYDELLLMQLAIALKREQRRRAARATPIEVSPEIDRRIRRRLRFTFTGAQDRVVAEIAADLARPYPMNRLLQGDVGAGKTAVALYAALAAVARRMQTAIMAPTEVLARQHFANVERYLADSRVRRVLLVGGLPIRERRRICGAIADGQIDLVVGTHALLERGVTFASLGVVVIDEQHKFGVRQRSTLRHKGLEAHLLTMSATPIPRSLAMTAFGELDISVIDELPPGRMPVATRLVRRHQVAEAWAFVRRQLRAGRQVFVVYPLVEESDTLPLRAAAREADLLAQDQLRGHAVGLLHGQMKPADKHAVMERFRARKLQVLVATTVIEVGLDVPNATVMVIHHAERYGLSQLHQLRGRIGRGGYEGHCLLMTDVDSLSSRRRLEVLVRSSDGFEVAEEDLRHRGPGELLGVQQHGDIGLRVARLPDDFDLLELAAGDARQIVAADPQLRRSDRAACRAELIRLHRHSLAWLDSG